MLELSEEEGMSCSAEGKCPRGSKTCLTLTSRASSDTFTIFMIVANILRMQLMGIILPGAYTVPNVLCTQHYTFLIIMEYKLHKQV